MINLQKLFRQGGRGSGNFGHRGRPGQVGGSASGWSEPKLPSDRDYSREDTSIADAMKGFEEEEKVKKVGKKEIIDNVTGDFDSVKKGIPSFIAQYNPSLKGYSKDPNVFTFAESYFYHIRDEGAFAESVMKDFRTSGKYEIEVLGQGDHFSPKFVGDAPTISPKSSFLWVVGKVKRK